VTLHSTSPAATLVSVVRDPDPRVTVSGYVASAVAKTLRNHSEMNAHVIEDELHTFAEVNLGIAVDVQAGLVVPVVRNADRSSPAELTAEIGALAAAARDGTLRPEQLAGATFTISNLGALGVEHFTPIIDPPQVAVLGVGAIKEVPVWDGNSWVASHVLYLSLSFDHGAVDGAPAARFLADLVAELSRSREVVASVGISKGDK